MGHSVSRDLVDWDYRGECFGPSEAGFDDLAIWTGSVVREDDRWRMFYTALSTAGHHIFDQRVGSPGVLGPWEMNKARPFLPEPDLFAAPVVRLRNEHSVIIGFRNLEPKGDLDNLGFEIIDPIPVTLDDEGYLVAR